MARQRERERERIMMTPGLRQLEAEQKRRKLLQEKGVGRAKLRETREISCKQAMRLERASNSSRDCQWPEGQGMIGDRISDPLLTQVSDASSANCCARRSSSNLRQLRRLCHLAPGVDQAVPEARSHLSHIRLGARRQQRGDPLSRATRLTVAAMTPSAAGIGNRWLETFQSRP